MGNASSTPNGFNKNTTAEQAASTADLAGKVIIVTGCSTGIGKETARVLLSHNAHVVMACRSKEKMSKAASEIQEAATKVAPNHQGKLTQMVLNLASLKSIKQFATDFIATGLPLHILCLNAGVMVPPLSYTEDGFETQFGTNHLGHFALANQLLAHMATTCGNEGKVVVVSSELHKRGKIVLEDLHWKKRSKKYGSGFLAYGDSKLANILFVRELQRRIQQTSHASNIAAYSLHPGVIPTELGRDNPTLQAVSRVILHFMYKTIEQGAATTVYLCCANKSVLKAGEYYSDCNVHECTKEAKDMAVAKKLWDESEKLTNTSFPL